MPSSQNPAGQQGTTRAAQLAASGDDLVLPFHTGQSGVSGRLIRLGPVVDEILKRHDYPEAVSVALGQAIALTALLGTALKFTGKLILQTKTDGPLGFLVADFEAPGRESICLDLGQRAMHQEAPT